MSLASEKKFTATEFLEWAETLPEGVRYELVDGVTVAMSPERNRHNLVKTDCLIALRQALGESEDCTVLGDGVSVPVDDKTVYEPDVTVQCYENIDLDETVARSPTIVVEVLSPATKSVDSNQKLSGYFQLPSVSHYLVIDPAKLVVIHYQRAHSTIETTICQSGRILLDPPGIELKIPDLFRSVSMAGRSN